MTRKAVAKVAAISGGAAGVPRPNQCGDAPGDERGPTGRDDHMADEAPPAGEDAQHDGSDEKAVVPHDGHPGHQPGDPRRDGDPRPAASAPAATTSQAMAATAAPMTGAHDVPGEAEALVRGGDEDPGPPGPRGARGRTPASSRRSPVRWASHQATASSTVAKEVLRARSGR